MLYRTIFCFAHENIRCSSFIVKDLNGLNFKNTFYVSINFEKDLNKNSQYNIMIGGYKYNMGQGQEQASKQSQLVDQNYANGTFFMAMSTLE